ncbi:MAG: LexA family transcriptional regulator [Pseudomonadota bacterium]
MPKTKYTFDIVFHDVFPKLLAQLGTKNQAEVAAFLDMTPGAITNFKKRNSFPADSLIKFAVKKNISVDWLLGRIEKPKLRNDYAVVKEFTEPYIAEVGRRFEDKQYVFLRLLNRYGELETQKMQFLKVHALRDWLLPQIKGDPDDAFMTVMEGDSMSETISPGDILFCDGQAGKIADVPIEDVIYVMNIEGSGPIVRRLQRLPNQMVKVIADNPRYDSFSISKDSDCNILGRVIWIARKT